MTSPTGDDATTGTRRRPAALAGLAVLAVLLVAGGWFLPLWQATLHAPQYPGGLVTIAYGSDVTGDLNEINALNHYVGLGVFDPSDVPEMALWPFALVAAAVAAVVAVAVRRGWPRRLALAYLWGLPVGVLAAIQYRLHEFGQAVEPGAAFRMEPFTPWVIGRTTVWNFETWAWPGLGLVALVLAAVLVTVGPRLLGRSGHRGVTPPGPEGPAADPSTDRGRATAIALLVALVALPGVSLGAAPAAAADQGPGTHDPGTHDPGTHDHGSHEGEAPGGHLDVRDGYAPVIGPGWHAPMPTIEHHPPMGDLASRLDAIETGGTLHLRAGTYTGPAVIDRPVTIEGHGLPIVQGDGTGSVLTITAPGTVVRGIVVQGSGPGPHGNPAGIRIEADDVTIEGVVVQDSYMGLAVDSAASVKLLGNHVHGRTDAPLADDGHAVSHDTDATDEAHDHGDLDDGAAADPGGSGAHGDHGDHGGHGAASSTAGAARGDGIWLHDVDHVLVRGNHVMGVRDGVYVSFGSHALVDSNHVHGSRYAVHTMFARELSLVQNHAQGNLSGAVLMYGEGALLLRNHIEGNLSPSTGFGAILKDITGVELVENLLVDNRISLHLDGPTEATLRANTIARSEVGVRAHSSAAGTFSGNSFVRNTIQVQSLGSTLDGLTWTDRGAGNHWDTYQGFDRGDGLGAVAHVEGGTVDRLLARNPELVALADTPAMQLLRTVEDRWGRRSPVVTDPVPLLEPISPPVPAAASAAPARGVATAVGVALLLPALVLVARPHRRVRLSRRSTRVVHA